MDVTTASRWAYTSKSSIPLLVSSMVHQYAPETAEYAYSTRTGTQYAVKYAQYAQWYAV
jgi:hypothetical protein